MRFLHKTISWCGMLMAALMNHGKQSCSVLVFQVRHESCLSIFYVVNWFVVTMLPFMVGPVFGCTVGIFCLLFGT
jgi:hypothetical protein